MSSASDQKSSGSPASSGGAVRSISASVMRRNRARSARPTVGRLGLRVRFGISSSLMALTAPRRDDATDQAIRIGSIGVHDCQANAMRAPNRDASDLTIVPPRVGALQRRPSEDRGTEGKIEPSKGQVAFALAWVPRETHKELYARIYTCARRARHLAKQASGLA